MLKQRNIIDDYLDSVLEICPEVDAEAIRYYSMKLTVSEYSSRHFIIHEGMLQNKINYVVSGLIRAFYINDKGVEINVSFIKEGEFAIHYEAFVSQKTSKYYFQSLEPTIIINIPYEHIWDCCDKYPSMERYLRIVLQKELYQKQQRIDSFIFENAETRYMNFTEKNPDLFKRLTISHLCSYLGIERQTLTRIRKKLANR